MARKQLEKSRYFTFLLYPESLPDEWLSKLESNIAEPVAISPLHDKDIMGYDDVGNVIYKKPHYHVMYIANSSVTADAVSKKIKRCLGNQSVALTKIVDNCENLYKYFTHESKDAIKKKKHVYSSADMVHLNNFDIARYIRFSKEEKDEFLQFLIRYIIENKIENMVELYERIEMGELKEKETVKAITMSCGIVRLAFDGCYQHRKKLNETD